MKGKFPAKVLQLMTNRHMDDDSTVSVRYHGRRFDVLLSPDYFTNSPDTTALYLEYLKAIDLDGDFEFEGVCDEDVYTWVIDTFQPFFEVLAPEPPFDPDKIASGEARPLLSEYLFPWAFTCRLDAEDEVLLPNILDGDVLDDLDTWIPWYKPTEVFVHFDDPKHALDQMPSEVSIPDGDGGRRICYFKEFGNCLPGGPIQRELLTYKNIHPLPETAPLGRHITVVHEKEQDTTLGLLLRYVPGGRTLSDRLWDDDVTDELKTKMGRAGRRGSKEVAWCGRGVGRRQDVECARG